MVSLWFLMALAVVSANPTKDTVIVESTIREVRAVAPKDLLLAATDDNYHNDYSVDDDGSVGYLKKSEDGGADGYKHFDSFHKKDGDKYGYEKHTSFGEASKYVNDADDKKDDSKEAQNSYKVAEELNEYDDGPTAQLSEYINYEGEADDGEHYTEGDSAAYTEGADAEEGTQNDDGESEKYTNEGDSDSESEKYTNEGDGEAEEINAEDEGDY